MYCKVLKFSITLQWKIKNISNTLHVMGAGDAPKS